MSVFGLGIAGAVIFGNSSVILGKSTVGLEKVALDNSGLVFGGTGGACLASEAEISNGALIGEGVSC